MTWFSHFLKVRSAKFISSLNGQFAERTKCPDKMWELRGLGDSVFGKDSRSTELWVKYCSLVH